MKLRRAAWQNKNSAVINRKGLWKVVRAVINRKGLLREAILPMCLDGTVKEKQSCRCAWMGLLRKAILPSLIGADCCSMIFWSRSLGDLLLFLWDEMGNFGGKKYQDDSENRAFWHDFGMEKGCSGNFANTFGCFAIFSRHKNHHLCTVNKKHYETKF